MRWSKLLQRVRLHSERLSHCGNAPRVCAFFWGGGVSLHGPIVWCQGLSFTSSTPLCYKANMSFFFFFWCLLALAKSFTATFWVGKTTFLFLWVSSVWSPACTWLATAMWWRVASWQKMILAELFCQILLWFFYAARCVTHCHSENALEWVHATLPDPAWMQPKSVLVYLFMCLFI